MPLTPFITLFLRLQPSLSKAACTAILGLAAVASGCGKPFNIKTQPDLPPAHYAAKVAAGSVTIQAQPVTDEDFLYERFDANLILAGVLPVRVILSNSGAEALDIKKTRFEIRPSQGRPGRAINERQAFKKLISYYEISTYSKTGYKESLEEFSAHGLDTRTPLSPGQSRDGLVFFSMPADAARAGGLTLIIEGLDGSDSRSRKKVELKLN
ncbi:MAG: hypothetical protein WAV20_23835 [Blastocatellia bacterium]